MFRRRTAAQDEPDTTGSTPTADPADTRSTAAGKGRPTPKRRDAEQARKDRVRPPRDRREALRLQRAQAKARRAKIQQAMTTGDDRYLPPRDKGPQRKFIRDFVDSRRTLAEYLLPFFLVVFVLMMMPNPWLVQVATVLWLFAIVMAPLDLFILSRRLKRELRTRFADESHRGATAYGLMRATQIRRLRLPKPQVRPGETPA